MKHLEKLKEENQDIQLILNWVEEYSTLNNNQTIFNNIKKNNTPSAKMLPNVSTAKNLSLFNNETTDRKNQINAELQNILHFNDKLNSNNYLNFSEDIIATIASPEFNIFELEKSIGSENTLSSISCFVFIDLGLYSVINYTNFENFVEFIRKGYNRKNSYHTDLHAADVEQTCYLFFKFGGLKDVLRLTDMDCAAFLIASIIHDFKHPGMTNMFLINSKNEIAIRYNGKIHFNFF